MAAISFGDLVAAVAETCGRPKQPERHELSDAEWQIVEPLLPGKPERGRIRRNDRQVINGMFYVLRTGCPWRDVPRKYGPWKTVFNRFNRWRAAGVIDAIAEALLKELDARGEIDWDLWCVDGSNVRAARCAANGRKKGARVTSLETMRSVARAVGSARSSTS